MQHDIHYQRSAHMSHPQSQFAPNAIAFGAPPSPAPGLVLPTPSMQNQIHELAKTLPPPRKQNTACDACRCAAIAHTHPIALSQLHSGRGK